MVYLKTPRYIAVLKIRALPILLWKSPEGGVKEKQTFQKSWRKWKLHWFGWPDVDQHLWPRCCPHGPPWARAACRRGGHQGSTSPAEHDELENSWSQNSWSPNTDGLYNTNSVNRTAAFLFSMYSVQFNQQKNSYVNDRLLLPTYCKL